MKISILTPDFSNNCFGRAWLLANLLRKYYEVEVIGPTFEKSIWKPLEKACDFPVKTVKGYTNGRFEFRRMLNAITGNVIYASKPLMSSFGVGLVKKFRTGKPLLLDIDDWELGLAKKIFDTSDWRKKLIDFLVSSVSWRSYYHIAFLDKLIFLVDHITVSGKILHSMYGGSIIWHARDSSILNPKHFKKSDLKKKYLGTSHGDLFIVGFIGTPRRHKGLEDLIDAIMILDSLKIMLVIVGVDGGSYSKELQKKVVQLGISNKVAFFPAQPFIKLPEFLTVTDLVVIPQRDTMFSYGQVPAKIFDAMAMAKPIVVTKVAEIPEIINGCGWIVEPRQPEKLADTIEYVYWHPDEARKKGEKALEKFTKKYSFEVMGNKLAEIVESLRKL